jgi:hydroxypyruvate reductase
MNREAGLLKGSLGFFYRAALSGVDPQVAVERSLRDPVIRGAVARAQRVGVFAAGKAAAAMLAGARSIDWDIGLAVLPRGYPAARFPRTRVLFASHPDPDRSSLLAAGKALEFFARFGPRDLIVCLISGGTSSLVAKPKPGLSLADKRAAVRRLAASGASIVRLNRVRTRLSSVKGGKLGRVTPARLVTLVLSDVPGDEPALVGSGPTVRARRGDITRVVATNRSGALAAARQAARRGLSSRMVRRRLSGDAFDAGRLFARSAAKLSAGQVLIVGGETTVDLPPRHGRGGRNLEFALGAAMELRGSRDIAILAAGSDGIDGSSGAAGAFVDGTTVDRAERLDLDPARALARHDTESFFERLGDLLVTGPTGTNVGDWAWAMRKPR